MVVAALEPSCAKSQMQHFRAAKLTQEAFHKATSERKHARALYKCLEANNKKCILHSWLLERGSPSWHVHALMSEATIFMFAFHGFSFMSATGRERSRDRSACRQSGNAKAAATSARTHICTCIS